MNIAPFANLNQAEITDLIIDGINFMQASNKSGGFAAYAINSTIRNVHVVNALLVAPDYSGGLIGGIEGTLVDHCSAQATLINGYGTHGSGGLIGVAVNSTIKNSFSDVLMTTNSSNYLIAVSSVV